MPFYLLLNIVFPYPAENETVFEMHLDECIIDLANYMTDSLKNRKNYDDPYKNKSRPFLLTYLKFMDDIIFIWTSSKIDLEIFFRQVKQ